MDATLVIVSRETIIKSANNVIEAILFERERLRKEVLKELMQPRRNWYGKIKIRTKDEAINELKYLETNIYSKYFNIFNFKHVLLNRSKLLLKVCEILYPGKDYCFLSLEDAELVYNWKDTNRFKDKININPEKTSIY